MGIKVWGGASVTNSSNTWNGDLGIYDSTVTFNYDLTAGDLIIEIETETEDGGLPVTTNPTLDLAGQTLTFNSFIHDFTDGVIDSVGGGQLIIQNTATELVLTLGAGQDKIFARLTVARTP